LQVTSNDGDQAAFQISGAHPFSMSGAYPLHRRPLNNELRGNVIVVDMEHPLAKRSGPEQRTWYDRTTNFAVTLPSTPADQGEQRRTVTTEYSQVAGMHE
jgi:hypothetical protein